MQERKYEAGEQLARKALEIDPNGTHGIYTRFSSSPKSSYQSDSVPSSPLSGRSFFVV